VAKAAKPKCDVDPVCNLDLKAIHGKFAYDFEDQTYWFCSEACREQFAAQPHKFIGAGAQPVCKVDPVCRLDLKAGHGKFAYDFEDETYWFCSEACREEFTAQPQKYLKETGK
jgi:Cu+-exporting ATPase